MVHGGAGAVELMADRMHPVWKTDSAVDAMEAYLAFVFRLPGAEQLPDCLEHVADGRALPFQLIAICFSLCSAVQ